MERSVPVPLPYLKSIASLIARRMMSSIVSSTDLDETGAALRIFVLRRGALGLARSRDCRNNSRARRPVPMPYW